MTFDDIAKMRKEGKFSLKNGSEITVGDTLVMDCFQSRFWRVLELEPQVRASSSGLPPARTAVCDHGKLTIFDSDVVEVLP